MSNQLSQYYVDAINRLDSIFVPTKEDQDSALKDKKTLEDHGYKLNIGYPFDEFYFQFGFQNAYSYYLYQYGIADAFEFED